MIKKSIGLLMALVLIFTGLFGNVSVYAAKSKTENVSIAKVWDGTADISWYTTKDGTWNVADKESYDIYTAEQLAGLYVLANKQDDNVDRPFRNVTINLRNDIVLNDTTDWENWLENAPANVWTPIGKKGSPGMGYKPFIGRFNGNGHTISGMYVDGGELGGLFGYTEDGACIYNLKIEKSVIKGTDASGFIVGNAHSTWISDCEVKDCTVSSAWSTGGIVGSTKCYLKGLQAFSQIVFAVISFGIVLNPILTGGFRDKNLPENGCIVTNCKVSDCKFLMSHVSQEPTCAGIMCDATDEDIIFNTFVENLEFESKFTAPLERKNRGKQVGLITSTGKGIQEVCYAVNCKRIDGSEEIVDSKIVKTISKKKAATEKFANKMGGAFVYKKGSTPEIAAIKEANINVVISGKGAKIDWKPIEETAKYKVYYTYKGKKTTVTTKSPSVVIKNIKKGGEYTVVIKAFYSGKKSKKIYGGQFKFKG